MNVQAAILADAPAAPAPVADTVRVKAPRTATAVARALAREAGEAGETFEALFPGARDPDRHLSDMHPEGRMEVSNQAVGRKWRSESGYLGRGDVSRFRGTRIALKRSAIAMILCCDDRSTFDELVKLKLIVRHTGDTNGVGAFYSFDPAWTMRDLHDHWVARHLGTPKRHADFRRYIEVRNACRMGADEEVPEAIMAAAVTLLAELGTSATAEINGFMPLGNGAVERCAEVRRRLNDCWRARAGDIPHVDADTVRATFPELAAARRTNLDTDLGHEWPGPTPDALGRAWRLGPLRRAAVLLLFICAAKERLAEEQMEIVRAFELVDEVFRALTPDGDPLDQGTIDLVAGTLAFGHLDAPVAPATRDRGVRGFIAGVGWLNRWIKHTGGAVFASFGCAQISERSATVANLTQVYGHLRKQASAERLDRTAKAAERLVMLQETAFLRKKGLCDTIGVARRAILDMGDAACVKFSVYDRVLGADGTLLPGAQRNDWIVWRRPKPGQDLPDVPSNPAPYRPPIAADTSGGGGGGDDDAARDEGAAAVDLDDYIFEFVDSVAAIGPDAHDPWYITCCEHGTWMAPALLDPEVQEARHRLIIDWKLPTYPSTPAGLLRFGTSDAALFRRMAAKGRTIVPLPQFAMAMRFAHLALRAVIEAYCRSGEFRQMMHRLSRWPTDGKDSRPDFRFCAFRKVTDGTKPTELDEFKVSEQTHDEAFELAEAIIDACHADIGEIPDIALPERLAWKCDPGPLIFSWMGKPLTLASLLVFLRYLLANTGEQLGFHDLRFANAKHGKSIGLTMIALQDALKHSHQGMTEYYAALTPELLAARTDEDLARRRADQARRSAFRMAA